eukprot:5697189-Prymnesium_polylepis.1
MQKQAKSSGSHVTRQFALPSVLRGRAHTLSHSARAPGRLMTSHKILTQARVAVEHASTQPFRRAGHDAMDLESERECAAQPAEGAGLGAPRPAFSHK